MASTMLSLFSATPLPIAYLALVRRKSQYKMEKRCTEILKGKESLSWYGWHLKARILEGGSWGRIFQREGIEKERSTRWDGYKQSDLVNKSLVSHLRGWGRVGSVKGNIRKLKRLVRPSSWRLSMPYSRIYTLLRLHKWGGTHLKPNFREHLAGMSSNYIRKNQEKQKQRMKTVVFARDEMLQTEPEILRKKGTVLGETDRKLLWKSHGQACSCF